MTDLEDPNEAGTEDKLEYIIDSLNANLVMTMRLYDVAMTFLQATHPEQAEILDKLHSEGKTITDFPFVTIENDGSEEKG